MAGVDPGASLGRVTAKAKSALREGAIAGAAIDVLDVEPPPPDHVLLARDMPNLLVAPHVASASEQARARLAGKLEQLVGPHLA